MHNIGVFLHSLVARSRPLAGLFFRIVALIKSYASQLRTVDFVSYSVGLAHARAFHHPVNQLRNGAVEAYLALPASDYCDLATHALRPRA